MASNSRVTCMNNLWILLQAQSSKQVNISRSYAWTAVGSIQVNIPRSTVPMRLWHQTCITERMNHTLVKTMHTLLLDTGLPNSFWFEAVQYTVYLHNIIPTHSLTHDITPEAWSSNKLNVVLVCVFRSKAFIHIPEKHCQKLDAKSLICTYLGYAKNH